VSLGRRCRLKSALLSLVQLVMALELGACPVAPGASISASLTLSLPVPEFTTMVSPSITRVTTPVISFPQQFPLMSRIAISSVSCRMALTYTLVSSLMALLGTAFVGCRSCANARAPSSSRRVWGRTMGRHITRSISSHAYGGHASGRRGLLSSNRSGAMAWVGRLSPRACPSPPAGSALSLSSHCSALNCSAKFPPLPALGGG